jgi:hypothetical protein
MKSGSLNLLEPSGPFQACTGIALPMGELIYISGVVFYWNPGFLPCFAALLDWYNFAQRIRMLLSTVHFFLLASLQFHTESCTRVSQHLTGHRYKYFHIIIFLDSWRRNFVWIRVPFIFQFSYIYINIIDSSSPKFVKFGTHIMLPAKYRGVILFGSYRLLLPAATPLCLWAVRLVAYVSTMNEQAGSENR